MGLFFFPEAVQPVMLPVRLTRSSLKQQSRLSRKSRLQQQRRKPEQELLMVRTISWSVTRTRIMFLILEGFYVQFLRSPTSTSRTGGNGRLTPESRFCCYWYRIAYSGCSNVEMLNWCKQWFKVKINKLIIVIHLVD